MSRPQGRFARSKARHGDSLWSQASNPRPLPALQPPPATGFTLIGALHLITEELQKVLISA